MKQILIIIFFIPTLMFGQKKVTEKQALEKSHIDFTSEYLIFSISGLIEIDGHTFKNDTCKCPIVYKANLNEITLSDTCKNIIYNQRKCDKIKCNVIHFQETYVPIRNEMQPGFKWHEPKFIIN